MMNRNREEFKDSEQDLSTWSKNTLIKCPSCSKMAELRNDKSVFQWYRNENAEIHCSHCNYILKQEKLQRFTLEIDHNCRNCGKKILRTIPNLTKPKEKIRIKCEHCGDSVEHYPKNIITWYTINQQGSAKDPIFGVSLWLQEQIKGHLFWAYNIDHLNYLEEYIGAELRKREGMTMAAKLPQFIKASKNRVHLLKLIDRLRQSVEKSSKSK